MDSYLFDVDGVLTNPQNRKINKPELVTFLITKLQRGSPIGFISGRGMLWLRSSVVKVLENYLYDHPGFDQNLLDNVFVSGEFGGVTCIHENGVRKESINQAFTIPDEVKRGLHLVAFQFSDICFIDTEKQTIFTVEANHMIKEEEFFENKDNLVAAFKQVIATYPDLEVQADRLGVNVRYKDANKRSVTDKFLQWLKGKKISPEKYFVFGDSPSDLEMGEELHRQQLQFEFIYVGGQSDMNSLHPSFPINATKGRFDEGTMEYLKSKSD